MNDIRLSKNTEGGLSLFIGSDLQFSTSDERLYHEPLGLLPALLAAQRGQAPIDALVLGGGDGLALREILKVPLSSATLVDISPEVLALGKGPLSAYNRGSLADTKVNVLAMDALTFEMGEHAYDLVVMDFTFPRTAGDCRLFSADFFRRIAASLKPGGILSMNSVSPELTPEAYACIGRTLRTAGLFPRPYALSIPSFEKQGYGKWGFYLASSTKIRDAEMRTLSFPAGSGLSSASAADAGELPLALCALAGKTKANHTDELLYYLSNSSQIKWNGDFGRPSFSADRRGNGPRLTASCGFAAWLRTPQGKRSLEELLLCVPSTGRLKAEGFVAQWGSQCETTFRGLNLEEFARETLKRAAELPKRFVRELRRLLALIKSKMPSSRELLFSAYRVFAIFLIMLVLVNVVFPDNLYAKGYSGGGGGWGGDGFIFSRSYRSHYYRSNFSTGNVRFRFTDSKGNALNTYSLMQLSKNMCVLDSGAISYEPGIPGFTCLLEPGKLTVLSQKEGGKLLELPATEELYIQTLEALEQQKKIIGPAMAEHRRWLEWIRWAPLSGEQKKMNMELTQLSNIDKALDTALATWKSSPPPKTQPRYGWKQIFPGIYAGERTASGPLRMISTSNDPSGDRYGKPPMLLFVNTDGSTVEFDPAMPPNMPETMIPERYVFIYRIMKKAAVEGTYPDMVFALQAWENVYPSLKPAPTSAPVGPIPPHP